MRRTQLLQSSRAVVEIVRVSLVEKKGAVGKDEGRGLFIVGRLKLYGPSLTEVCTGEPRCFGCVGVYALLLGRIPQARSVLFCQPMTAFTCTGPEGCPKVTPWEQFPGLFRPSCMAWLTTEGLGRCGIVSYATLESFLIAKPSIPRSREA